MLLEKLLVGACNFTKSIAPPGCFSSFLNCRNGTKSSKASRIYLVRCFYREKGKQTKLILLDTRGDKNSHRRYPRKKYALKDLVIFTGKTCVGVSF